MDKRYSQAVWRVLFVVVFCLSLVGIPTIHVLANGPFLVDSLDDEEDINFTDGLCLTSLNTCTLRAAIQQSNYNADANIINFSISGTITLTSSLPVILHDLTIDGTFQSISISGNDAVQIMWINPGVAVTLSHLTFEGGHPPVYYGGAIVNYGNLTVTESNFFNNQSGQGGAIHNDEGSLTISNSTFLNNDSPLGGAINTYDGIVNIDNCTFIGNHATVEGGAFFGTQNLAGSMMMITNSTFDANTADDKGGALAINYGTAVVANSTFSGNSAGYAGGGIRNTFGSLTVLNSTFSGNSAGQFGGGIMDYIGGMHLKNSIFANSTGGVDCYEKQAIGSSVNNLMETHFNCGTPVSSADPNLGQLASNGGSTQTFELLAGSPALNAGDDATCLATPVNGVDQRGVTRPFGAHCDIGSFERNKGKLTARSDGAYDGWILESAEFSNQGGSLDRFSPLLFLGDGTADRQYVAVLSFNTVLPANAVITRVRLKIRRDGPTSFVGGNPFTRLGKLKVDIVTPYFGYDIALRLSDFQEAAGMPNAASFISTPVSDWYTATLGSAVYPFINLSGTTQFRLRFGRDDNDNRAADYMKFRSGNHATVTTRPTLIIEYYVP